MDRSKRHVSSRLEIASGGNSLVGRSGRHEERPPRHWYQCSSEEDVRKVLAASLPPISHIVQVAVFFNRTPKAVRHAIARGTFPPGRLIAGRRCWTHEDLVYFLLETEARPSYPKAELVKVITRPAPHDPEHRVQVDMTFDCKDPRSSKELPLRIQKTAPVGQTLDSAKEWAKENADRFLAEIFGKTMR